MPNANKEPLAEWTLDKGYISAVMRGLGSNHMAKGSVNGMITGTGLVRAFRGPLLKAGLVGSRVFFTTDESFAGLGTVAVNGVGSVFKVRSAIFFIGAGQVNYAGAAIAAVVASSTFSYVVKVGGVYLAANEYQVGHAQPSAPVLYAKDVPSPGQLAMSAAVAVVIWRIDSVTGQVSLMSLPSNVVTLSGQSAIVQIPLADNNGQDLFGIGVPRIGFGDLGNFYELPTSSGGEVAEATLAYTRAAGNVTFTNTSDTAVIAGGVTSADVGRRVSTVSFDTWITSIVDATHVKIFDIPGATTTHAGTITHAVDGITRAVEISWANGYLLEQNLAPDKAFPPVAADFALPMNDVIVLDAAGILYVSEPNTVGSFAPSNALFASAPAVLYLDAPEGIKLRFMKNAIGALYYVGGRPAVRYYEFRKHQGLKYPQNAFTGFNGRPCAWLGRPALIDDNLEADFSYADNVMPEFDGWDAGQTAIKPIVGGYDGFGQYECWGFGKVIMAKYGPTGAWCSPTDLIGLIPGNIVAATTVDHALYLSVINGAALAIYQYDAGTGSVMVIQPDDKVSEGMFDTITQILVRGRADSIVDPVVVELVSNFDDDSPVADQYAGQPEQKPSEVGTQFFETRRPNEQMSRAHAPRITMTGHGGDCGVDKIITYGATSDTVI